MTKLERDVLAWIYTLHAGIKHYYYSDAELFYEAGQPTARGEQLRKHMEKFFPSV